MLDNGRCFTLAEEVRQLSEHFLSKVADLLVGPSPRLGQREDRRQLLGRETAAIGAISFDVSGMMSVAISGAVSVTVPGSVPGRRNVEIQMQPHSKQGRALLQTVSRGCLEIIPQRNNRIVFPGSGDPGARGRSSRAQRSRRTRRRPCAPAALGPRRSGAGSPRRGTRRGP